MNTLQVLLADDHAVVREGLKALICSQPDMEVVGEASTGRSAWQLAVATQPDVVIMDISMPDLGGAEATELIRRDCPSSHVLALTVHEVEGYLRRMLEAGACGYMLKRAAAADLVKAVRHVAAGGIFIDPGLANEVISGFVATPAREKNNNTELTDRELQVVKLLARGYINREIANQLRLSMKTIEVHKARALEKLGMHSRAELVDYAMRRGWLQSEHIG
jgi:DNA-binding NarL/FixJ family response regulator